MSLEELARRLSERFELESVVVFRESEVVYKSGTADVSQLSRLVESVRRLVRLSQILELTRPSTVRLLAGDRVILVIESGAETLIAIARAGDVSVVERVESILREHAL